MKQFFILLSLLFIATIPMRAERSRVIVMSDIGGSDPDDQQAFVHLLTLLDRIDLEGFIFQHAWVSYNKGNEVNVTNHVLRAYEEVIPRLRKHSDGFPETETLRKLIRHGQTEAAMKGVGEGKDSPGSELIIETVDRNDERPVWIAAWSGLSTLAQSLWKVKQTRTAEEVQKFVSKIRVYDILGQDDAGAWIVTQFPDLLYIRNTAVYGWAPSDEWTTPNVQAVGPLGKEYPNRIWATEGDSPAFLYFVDNGLNFPEHPDWGGWGGRFALEKKAGIRSMDWVAKNGLDETKYDPYYMLGASEEGGSAISKWKEDIYNDFAARMQWSITEDYNDANHHPIAAIGRDKSTSAVHKTVKAGKVLRLDASRSTDPDNDELSHQWIFYKEPGTYRGNLDLQASQGKLSVLLPPEAKGCTIHLILRVSDNGQPSLTDYRRIIVHCR